MKRILTILAMMLCIVSVQAQNKYKNGEDYEFILPSVPWLSMEYPENKKIEKGVQTYRALSYNGLYAFIYNEKHCGYYDVPSELRTGFKSNVVDLQKENGTLYWKRVKQIMADIDKYWSEHTPTSINHVGLTENVVEDLDETAGPVYENVEQMPSFPGGIGALMQYLTTNIKYPVVAEENGIQGRVVCTYIVERDGSLTNISVSRSVDPSLDKEAVRIISSMPRWIPGKHNGSLCRVKYTLPVTFRLQ